MEGEEGKLLPSQEAIKRHELKAKSESFICPTPLLSIKITRKKALRRFDNREKKRNGHAKSPIKKEEGLSVCFKIKDIILFYDITKKCTRTINRGK